MDPLGYGGGRRENFPQSSIFYRRENLDAKTVTAK